MSKSYMTRAAVLAAARTWLGTPYHHQMSVNGVGCDCLGLVRGVFEELYGDIGERVPPYTRDWTEARRRETLIEAASRYLVATERLEDPLPGDVLIFRLNEGAMAKHVGIYSGQEKMIHAQEKVGCVEIAMGRWWRRRVAAVFEFPGVV